MPEPRKNHTLFQALQEAAHRVAANNEDYIFIADGVEWDRVMDEMFKLAIVNRPTRDLIHDWGQMRFTGIDLIRVPKGCETFPVIPWLEKEDASTETE